MTRPDISKLVDKNGVPYELEGSFKTPGGYKACIERIPYRSDSGRRDITMTETSKEYLDRLIRDADYDDVEVPKCLTEEYGNLCRQEERDLIRLKIMHVIHCCESDYAYDLGLEIEEALSDE